MNHYSHPTSGALRAWQTTLLALALATTAGGAFAQTVTEVFVSKGVDYVQTDGSTIIIDPAPPGPKYGGPYDAGVTVKGQNLASITAPTVSGPISVPAGYFNGGNLVYNTSDNQWAFGAPYGNNAGFATAAARDAAFGSGTYLVTVNGATLSLTLSGDAYPTAPVLTLTGGNWSGGVYDVNAGQSVTITTSAFSGYGSHVNDAIQLTGTSTNNNSFSVLQLHSAVPGTNFLSYTIPGSQLQAGVNYAVEASFAAIVGEEASATLPGSINAALYASSTGFDISVAAVPLPAASWILFSGLTGLGVLARRSRRTATRTSL